MLHYLSGSVSKCQRCVICPSQSQSANVVLPVPVNLRLPTLCYLSQSVSECHVVIPVPVSLRARTLSYLSQSVSGRGRCLTCPSQSQSADILLPVPVSLRVRTLYYLSQSVSECGHCITCPSSQSQRAGNVLPRYLQEAAQAEDVSMVRLSLSWLLSQPAVTSVITGQSGVFIGAPGRGLNGVLCQASVLKYCLDLAGRLNGTVRLYYIIPVLYVFSGWVKPWSRVDTFSELCFPF